MSGDATYAGASNGHEPQPNGAQERPPFPLVVGCRRSGTTLLRAMLSSHPEVAVPPESRFLLNFAPETYQRFDSLRLLDDLYDNESFGLWKLRRQVVAASFREHPPESYAAAIRRLYELWAEPRGKVRYADKTPDHVLRIGAVTALFPEARVVHIVRDGRDVAASFLELGWVDRIERAALHWRYRVLRGREIGSLLPKRRYHELFYEDLVARPEPTLRAMCAALDLPFHPAMLRYEKAAAENRRSEAYPHHNRYVGRPLRPGLRDWRRDMPDTAVRRFEAVAGDALEEFGYELRARTRRPPLGTRLVGRRHVLRWRTQRFTRSGRAALEGER
jgi:hypothetical protein